jgi:hypothetical protein
MNPDSAINFLASLELPENEYSKAGKEKVAEYGGYNVISDAVAISIFESIVLPSLSDFVRVKKGLFVKQVDKDIFHVLTFKQGKTAYGFGWGVSLAYVPHKWDETCKFHRTLKSARCDLFDQEHNLRKDRTSAMNPPYNMIDFFLGEICFRDDLVRAWTNLEPIIRTWLTSITTLDEVLNQAKFQVTHSHHYQCHFPSPRLVYAFTLARLGRVEEGAATLKDLMKSESQFYSSEELPKALRQIAKCELPNG